MKNNLLPSESNRKNAISLVHLGSSAQLNPYLSNNVRLRGLGLANPDGKYTQQQVLDHFYLNHPVVRKFFSYDHIQSRHLILPPKDPHTGELKEESYGELLEKFQKHSLKIGGDAVQASLERLNLAPMDIDFICCVTSTGFVIPALSALTCKAQGFRNDCQRFDIVGMGCNAGLNGLNATSSWCAANPGKTALLLCVEICSAIYTVDDTPETAITNSLFGDGAAALILKNEKSEDSGLRVLGFESHLIPEHSDQLRFDWNPGKNRYSFHVGKETPKAIAAVADLPLNRILGRFNLKKDDITHWILHGGGSAILNGIQEKFNLSEHSLRHSRSVLRDFGNLSSGSFLFSYARLMQEGAIQAGDLCMMMTMGPGLTIEMCLLQAEN